MQFLFELALTTYGIARPTDTDHGSAGNRAPTGQGLTYEDTRTFLIVKDGEQYCEIQMVVDLKDLKGFRLSDQS